MVLMYDFFISDSYMRNILYTGLWENLTVFDGEFQFECIRR